MIVVRRTKLVEGTRSPCRKHSQLELTTHQLKKRPAIDSYVTTGASYIVGFLTQYLFSFRL